MIGTTALASHRQKYLQWDVQDTSAANSSASTPVVTPCPCGRTLQPLCCHVEEAAEALVIWLCDVEGRELQAGSSCIHCRCRNLLGLIH